MLFRCILLKYHAKIAVQLITFNAVVKYFERYFQLGVFLF